jgi:hypothetical protein
VGVLVGQGGQFLLVGPPTHLGRGDPLLVETLDAPGVQELAHFLGPVGDLRVPLAAMNDPHAQLAGQAVEDAVVHEVADLLGVRPVQPAVGKQVLGDVQEALLRPVGDEAGIGAVFQHGSGSGLAPAVPQPPHVHVPPIQRPLGGMPLGGPSVGVPSLDRRVDIQDAVLVAPLEQLAAVDVPRQVHQQVPRPQEPAQQGPQVFRGHPLADEADALGRPRPQGLRRVLEVQHRKVLQGDLHVPDEDWQGAARHRAESQEQHLAVELEHRRHEPTRYAPGSTMPPGT